MARLEADWGVFFLYILFFGLFLKVVTERTGNEVGGFRKEPGSPRGQPHYLPEHCPPPSAPADWGVSDRMECRCPQASGKHSSSEDPSSLLNITNIFRNTNSNANDYFMEKKYCLSTVLLFTYSKMGTCVS